MAHSAAAVLRAVQRNILNDNLAQARKDIDALLVRLPAHAEALHLSGIIRVCNGDAATSIRLLKSAVRLRPKLPAWINDLGVAYSSDGKWDKAARAFSTAARIDTTRAQYLVNAATALLCAGKYRDAIGVAERAMARFGLSREALRCFVESSLAIGQFDSTLTRLLALSTPPSAASYVHESLAQCYSRLRQYDRALAHARKFARSEPADARAQLLFGTALWDAGYARQAASVFRRSSEAEPENAEAHSAYINALLHCPEHTSAQLKRACVAWGAKYAKATARRSFANAADPKRVLRIGYLTGEFAVVPAYSFLHPIISSHDRERFHITCYHARATSDQRTDGMRQASDRWRDVYRISDGKLEHFIRQDEIDILVDCSGHYAYGRLPVFARRAAPIQVVMPNCPSTTGVPQIDYLLTDRWVSPPGTEKEYTEQVWRLRSGYLVYTPPVKAPALTRLPARTNGYVTFGIFQRPSKLNGDVWDCAAGILSAVHDSRLLIHFCSADLDRAGSQTRERIVRRFVSRGIDRQRLDFRGYRPEFEHLQTIAECDIALDTFPYNGQTTTCECLWMGVPVVSLVGESHVARVGQGILGRVGMKRWLTATADDYVSRAVSFGSNLSRLARIRRKLRGRMQSSPLCNGPAAARSIEAAYREMWRRWCRGESASPGAC